MPQDLAACFAGKSIIRTRYHGIHSGANIIGLKREDKSYLINPVTRNHTQLLSDQLFALGTKAQIDHLRSDHYYRWLKIGIRMAYS